mgnify:CR=1 FL=1
MEITLDQKEIIFRGHAMECRINAEDPITFQPSPGLITKMHIPGGFGVRYDSHIYGGYTVPPYYDSMLAKLIVWAPDRAAACERLSLALRDTVYLGIPTNVDFLRRVVDDEAFRTAAISTDMSQPSRAATLHSRKAHRQFDRQMSRHAVP